MKRKSRWIAAVLNLLVPGLGHVYSRYILKGIILYLVLIFADFSARFFAHQLDFFLLETIFSVIFFLYLIISGYRAIHKEKDYKPLNWDQWFFYILIFIAHKFLYNSISSFDEVEIVSESMAPTLQPGDRIVSLKTSSASRNDVVVFKYPDVPAVKYIYRCIGLPGETLQIEKGVVYINNKVLRGGPDLLLPYNIATESPTNVYQILTDFADSDSGGTTELASANLKYLSDTSFMAYATTKEAVRLVRLTNIKKVNRYLTRTDMGESRLFPKGNTFGWSNDFYGPLYIPGKGGRIPINQDNINLYAKCIAFENDNAKISEAGVFINGTQIKEYVFKENYYFMMGDNRANATDSRYWGFLPERLIVGKAMYFESSINKHLGERIE